MKKLFVFLVTCFLLPLTANAQRVSRSYLDCPLTEVLTDLSHVAKRQRIIFIYNDLEDFTVTQRFDLLSVVEAIRTCIGHYPVNLTELGDSIIIVSSTQHQPYRVKGRLVDEQGRPVSEANIMLTTGDTLHVARGISDLNGRFVVPTNLENGTIHISHVAYRPVSQSFTAGDMGTLRLSPALISVDSVSVTPVANRPAKVKRSVRRYWDFAHEIEQKVWNMDLPQFKIDTLPAKYRDADAVVLAEYDSVEYRRVQRVVPFYLIFPIPAVWKEIHTRSLHRTRIFINSERAARDNSNITYSKKYDRTEYLEIRGLLNSTVMGIRVIKPNGKVITIDTEPFFRPYDTYDYILEDTIDTIHISQLEKGDILDIFKYRRNMDDEIQNLQVFAPNRTYPTLHYDCRIKLNKHLNLQHIQLNGFPDFDYQKKLNKKAFLLSSSLNDFANNVDSLPITYCYVRKAKKKYGPRFSDKPGIISNPSLEAILDDPYYRRMCKEQNYHSDRREIFVGVDSLRCFAIIDSIIGLNITEMEKARFLYIFVCHGGVEKQSATSFRAPSHKTIYPQTNYFGIFANALISAGIPFDYAYTTEHDKEPVDKLMDASNLITFIRLKDGTLYFPKHGTQVNEVPEDLRGRKAVLADWSEFFTLPKE